MLSIHTYITVLGADKLSLILHVLELISVIKQDSISLTDWVKEKFKNCITISPKY